ncbi:MAG TPA: HAMP domain-containing sensor histidine kinase [Lachnospiraceae bacterium]
MKKRHLWTRMLVLIGVGVAVVLFLMVTSFHLLMKNHMEEITRSSIEQGFLARYVEDDVSLLPVVDEDEVFFPVYTMITNQDGKIVGNWYMGSEKTLGEKILLSLGEGGIKNNHPILKEVGNSSYLIEKRTCRGGFDGYSVVGDSKDEKENYDIYVYVNATSIQKMIGKMDFRIALLFLSFGCLVAVFASRELKRVALSFGSLNDYLKEVGIRKNDAKKPDLLYKEFDDAVQTVEIMDCLLRQAEETKRIFFQNASHELRTPLMSIQGYAEGMKAGVISKEEGSKVIEKQSQKMAKLVDEILFLSKFEQENLQLEEVNLIPLIYDTASLFASNQQKNIIFEWQLPEKMILQCDENLMEKVVDNLLSNACRYAKNKVSVFAYEDKGNACLEVIDDGYGISKDDLPHIFERFYKGNEGNFGIGLSMVEEIIKKHGGQIEVESRRGRTRFLVMLPLNKK